MRTVRCLKDKVASGHYIVLVHALDRIGGNRINFNQTTTENYYKVISKNLREYAQKKRAYLNQENRQVEERHKDGSVSYRKAQATGLNFFREQNPTASIDIESQNDSVGFSQGSVDFNHHLLIDFERTYTRYTRFDGRSVDENLDFDDTISVLVPP